jgi:hypothetical protein
MAEPAVAVSSSTRTTLESLREIQAWGQSFNPPEPSPGATAPDYCLAASRFIVGKLVKLFPENRHLNDFLGDKKAVGSLGMDGQRLRFAWGRLSAPDSRPDVNPRADFNTSVLPAAIAWGGLKEEGARDIEYVSSVGNAALGDQLLGQSVPIVVGVSLGASKTRDHFITLVADRAGNIWAIDSWAASQAASVVQLPAGASLLKGITVNLNAGTTQIPSPKPYIGFYRHRKSKTPLSLKIAL